jgi:hypothetical protein
MIPTMILFGLLFGRWWLPCLLASSLFWPFLLISDGSEGFGLGLLGATALGVLNTAVGVGVHQGVLYLVRAGRGDRAERDHVPPSTSGVG